MWTGGKVASQSLGTLQEEWMICPVENMKPNWDSGSVPDLEAILEVVL